MFVNSLKARDVPIFQHLSIFHADGPKFPSFPIEIGDACSKPYWECGCPNLNRGLARARMLPVSAPGSEFSADRFTAFNGFANDLLHEGFEQV